HSTAIAGGSAMSDHRIQHTGRPRLKMILLSIVVLPGAYFALRATGAADPPAAAPLYSPLACESAAGCCPATPFAYTLSLPIDGPITNETGLLQGVPHALYVSKLNA